MPEKDRFLGVEFGSTRIKAVAIDSDRLPVASGDYIWAARHENGVWTYPLEQVWEGLRTALAAVEGRERIAAMGVSAMMHGYLAFDRDWNLLVPFRTWQNTMTGQAAAMLTDLFGFNIPQRWSIAHLCQAVMNGEEHVPRIAHITTLAGYVHYMLTGVNAVGVGEASGIMPLGPDLGYDKEMIAKFDVFASMMGVPWSVADLLPGILSAGENAGYLTESGSELLGGLLAPGVAFAPCEGDAGTGMVATNAVAPRTGNVSAGTSIFSMIVLERPLKRVYPEVGVVATPSGSPVAMVHCSNCTSDINGWAALIREAVGLFGGDAEELYTKLFLKSLEGDPDCGGLLFYNYLTGESVTHFDEGRPLFLRSPDASFSLANFMRAMLYSSMATLRTGMELLSEEGVAIDSLTGHGGLFKTPGVAQRFLAAACRAPVTFLETAGEGGPYGMALLSAYMMQKAPGQTLEAFLAEHFASAKSVTLAPDERDAAGFDAYLEKFKKGLAVERSAVENL